MLDSKILAFPFLPDFLQYMEILELVGRVMDLYQGTGTGAHRIWSTSQPLEYGRTSWGRKHDQSRDLPATQVRGAAV